MSIANQNDTSSNNETAKKLASLRARASQQPISYKMLFDEAMELSSDLFHRAMCAEAEVSRLRVLAKRLEAVQHLCEEAQKGLPNG